MLKPKSSVVIGVLTFVAILLVWVVFASGFKSLFHLKWDAELYYRIAERGYEVFPCDNDMGRSSCASSAWFPMWPALNAGLAGLTGIRLDASFRILGTLFTLMGWVLVAVFSTRISAQLTVTNDFKTTLWSLVLLSCFPTGFFFVTGHPYGLLLLLQMLYLVLLQKPWTQWPLVPLFFLGLAISFSYSIAPLFVALPLALLFLDPVTLMPNLSGQDRLKKIQTSFILLVPFIIGPILVFLFQDFQTGVKGTFALAQSRYGRGDFGNPFPILWQDLISGPPEERFAYLWFGLALVFAARLRPRVPRQYWLYSLGLYFFTPMTGSSESNYRHYVLMFPLAWVLGHEDTPIWQKVTLIVTGLGLMSGWYMKMWV